MIITIKIIKMIKIIKIILKAVNILRLLLSAGSAQGKNLRLVSDKVSLIDWWLVGDNQLIIARKETFPCCAP